MTKHVLSKPIHARFLSLPPFLPPIHSLSFSLFFLSLASRTHSLPYSHTRALAYPQTFEKAATAAATEQMQQQQQLQQHMSTLQHTNDTLQASLSSTYLARDAVHDSLVMVEISHDATCTQVFFPSEKSAHD